MSDIAAKGKRVVMKTNDGIYSHYDRSDKTKIIEVNPTPGCLTGFTPRFERKSHSIGGTSFESLKDVNLSHLNKLKEKATSNDLDANLNPLENQFERTQYPTFKGSSHSHSSEYPDYLKY